MNILVVEPMQCPRRAEIGGELADLQNAVGGPIEAVYPFRDEVALICNESGKIEGLPLNRGLFDESGNLYDIIAGTFLVAGLEKDSFGSLPEALSEKYEKVFHSPELFFRSGNTIRSVRTEPGPKQTVRNVPGGDAR